MSEAARGPRGGFSGAYWGPLGALLGLSRGSLGSTGAPVGATFAAIDQRREAPDRAPPLGGHDLREG
eukprot:2348775-Pyramimonas_sp.AAC.1